jgi:hypothetical protein
MLLITKRRLASRSADDNTSGGEETNSKAQEMRLRDSAEFTRIVQAKTAIFII